MCSKTHSEESKFALVFCKVEWNKKSIRVSKLRILITICLHHVFIRPNIRSRHWCDTKWYKKVDCKQECPCPWWSSVTNNVMFTRCEIRAITRPWNLTSQTCLSFLFCFSRASFHRANARTITIPFVETTERLTGICAIYSARVPVVWEEQ